MKTGQKLLIKTVFGSAFYFACLALPVQAQEQPEEQPIQLSEEVPPQPVQEEAVVEVQEETDPQPQTDPQLPEETVEPYTGWSDDNTQYFVEDAPVDGVTNIEGDYYLFQDQTFRVDFTGVAKAGDTGQWVFLRNGRSDWTFTGLSKHIENGKWVFTRDGRLDLSFTGVAKSVLNDQWYHANRGELDWKFTGFSKSVLNGKWFFSRNGKLDWSFTGVAKSIENNQWYHCKNGVLDWGFTGFSKSIENGKWYFSRNGKLNWNYTGLGKSVANNQWYHGKQGRLDWGFTGVSRSYLTDRFYYSHKGKLDWTYYGFGRSIEDGKEYFCLDGRVQHELSGMIFNVRDLFHYFVDHGQKVVKTGLNKMNGHTYLFFHHNSGVAVDSFEYLKDYGRRQISYFDGSGHLCTGRFYAQNHWYNADANGAIAGEGAKRVMWCLDIANNNWHGYSLYRRTSRRDYDCSSLVYYSLLDNGYSASKMGRNTPFTTFIMDEYMLKLGFKRYTYAAVKNSLKLGDVLVGNTLFDHTETYFGNGNTVGAHMGDLDGTWGDSSGREISVVSNSLYDYGWEFVYRKG